MGAALALAACPWGRLSLGCMPIGCLGLGCMPLGLPWPWLHAWPWQHAHGGLPRPWLLHDMALAGACRWGAALALAACLGLVACPWVAV